MIIKKINADENKRSKQHYFLPANLPIPPKTNPPPPQSYPYLDKLKLMTIAKSDFNMLNGVGWGVSHSSQLGRFRTYIKPRLY